MPTGRNELIGATATPLRADYTCQRELLLGHGRDLLARGCDGIVLFGTTGEGPCLPVAERRSVLEFLLERGLPPERLIVASGSASLADAIELTRHALAAGVARVLLMPPFFLRAAATEEGTYRFYAEVALRVADHRLRLLLYHFPEISGVALTAPLIRRLSDAFGEVVLGIKDSGGDWNETATFLQAFPELRVYTGTEVHARRAIQAGGAGTICGLANVIPQALRQFLDAPEDEAGSWLAWIQAVDDALSAGPFLPACKAAMAAASGVADWRRVLPPLSALDDAAFDRLAETLGTLAEQHGLLLG